MRVRKETQSDRHAVHAMNVAAFGQPLEADLVDRLRETCPEAISLVAVEDDAVVGHILFTPVTIERADGPSRVGMGLAPMAVASAKQRQGIGSRLVKQGLAELRARACPFVVVVGHPEYYPRFGFERASSRGIESQWPGIPDDAFMILVLDDVTMRDVRGVARYRSEFSDV